MGTTVEAVAAVTGGWRRRGGRRLADAAARRCLRRAGIEASEVDLLVNAGLYHDRNLGEPALAALVQDDIGANPEDPHEGHHGTFSFDVANGACGMLTALQVVDGFLAAGTIRRALVVASDAHPGRGRADRFPFRPAGGALLCGWEDGDGGLTGFRFAATGTDDAEGFTATIALRRGRNRLQVAQTPAFAERAAATAAEVAQALLDEHGIAPGAVDLVVANPQQPAFLGPLAQHLGVPADRVVQASNAGGVHTAALAVAWAHAERAGALSAAGTVLLVSAGAGIVAGAALFHQPSHAAGPGGG